MASARRHFQEDQRSTALKAQVDAWEQAARIRSYCDALDKVNADDPQPGEQLREWIAWSRRHADHLDPTERLDNLIPEEVEPRREDLRPYLGRWSPYGPDER